MSSKQTKLNPNKVLKVRTKLEKLLDRNRVIDGNNTTVRGGAFIDAHSKCDLSLERSHDGNADDSTGFRLIREDVG